MLDVCLIVSDVDLGETNTDNMHVYIFLRKFAVHFFQLLTDICVGINVCMHKQGVIEIINTLGKNIFYCFFLVARETHPNHSLDVHSGILVIAL